MNYNFHFQNETCRNKKYDTFLILLLLSIHPCHLVFEKGAKIYAWDVFVAINIIWKFGDYIFLNEGDIENFS